MAVPPTTIVGLGGHFKGQAATFSGTRVSIGRNRTHALCFTGDLSLSRDHAVLTYDGETWNIRDLGSRNGTWVNGKPLLNTYPHPLRPGDSFRCGAQTFEIAWDAVSGPVLLGTPVEPPPVQRIPPPPPSLIRASARPNHWVKKGEAVEIHGRHITAGLFFFGTGLRDLAGWGMEPALVDPELDVASEGPLRESTTPYSPTYRTLGPVGRSQYLDWLAAGRPAETMSDDHGLLFLSGIERRCIKAKRGQMTADAEAFREIRRLAEGAPKQSVAAARMREFLFYVAVQQETQDSYLDAEIDLSRLERGRSMVAHYQLARKAKDEAPLLADEVLAAMLLNGDIAPRTPFYRCHQEVLTIFRRLYEAKYKKGITLKVATHGLDLGYWASNPTIGTAWLPRTGLFSYRIPPSTQKKIREFLATATDALDPYSRRLATRPQDAGRLPTLALYPPELLRDHETIRALAEIAAAAPGGRVPSAAIAEHWVDWPERPLSKSERECLAMALWAAGYAMEPNYASTVPIVPDGAVYVTPHGPEDDSEGNEDYRSALPMMNLVATVILGNGRPHEVDRERICFRVAEMAGVWGSEAQRLRVYLQFLLEFGAPKLLKKGFDLIPPSRREPLLMILAEIISGDGHLGPAETTELLRIAKGLGIKEEDVYPLLHRSSGAAIPRPKAAGRSRESLFDMKSIADKLASSQAAAEILGAVFVEEEPVSAPAVPIVAAPAETGFAAFVRELSGQDSWSAAEFGALAKRYGKMPAGAYDELNEAAYDAVGDPLLEGDDPIAVDQTVAAEMLL